MIIARKRRNSGHGAFTLMELMVVIAILVVLVGIGGFYYMQTWEDAKVSAAQLQIKGDLAPACKTYRLKTQSWPPSLRDLLQKTPDGMYGPFLDSEAAVLDPWKQEYQYDPSGPHHNGLEPDIFTTVPGKGIVIGNWD
jgi:general secretion pathway protein G